MKNLNKDNQLIDFIKIIIKDLKPSILEANHLLDFYDNINTTTGEIKTKNRLGQQITPFKTAFYNGLEFKIYETGLITLSGSLHKYWNNGEHNYNDFDLTSVLCVLKDLKSKFNIVAENSVLKCLEIGINIIPSIPTNEVLKHCFLHKTKPFEDLKNSDEGKYKQAQHSQYIIKIYNKALHYRSKGFDIKDEILRFEIKYTKMQKLNEKDIYSLQDLINYGIHKFKNELLNEFNSILFYDNTIRSKSKSISNYKNPIYWSDLVTNKQKDLFNYHRKQLRELTSKNSDKIQEGIGQIMSEKIDLLNANTTQIDPLVILSKRVVSNKSSETTNALCEITKINISMQKENSILLSHTGLKYYLMNDPRLFEKIKRTYLSKQWINSDLEIQIKEIAHNIRNTKSNIAIKQKRMYKPQQLNLLSNLESYVSFYV